MLEIFTIQEKDINILFDIVQEKSLLSAIGMLSLVDMSRFSSRIISVFKESMEGQSPAIFQLFKEVLKNEIGLDIIRESLSQMDQTKLHVMIFKIKLLCFTGDNEEALILVNSALESYPDSNDLAFIKAHIQKEMGAFKDANETVSKIKNSVTGDKFSVSKVAKYMMRYGSITEAQELMGKFIQKPDQKERMGDLHEMQAVWYLIEMADRLLKDQKFLYAACFYRKIEMIFAEFIDDQLDFHGYSLRRMSFIEYINFLRFLDNQLKTSKILMRAHIGVSRCLMKIIDLNENNADCLVDKMSTASISNLFDDDISADIDYFRSLVATQKNCDDYLIRISNSLMSNHPNDLDALQAALDISLRTNSLLTAQKLSMKLLENGVNVSNSVVDRINTQRRAEIESLWKHVPLLN